MKRAFCISSVGLTALVIASSTLLSPLSASAEERSILVQPKIKTFKVNDTAAEVEIPQGKNRPKTQEFRVDDEANAGDETQQAETEQVKRPDRPKVKQFRVEDETNVDEDAQQAETNRPKRPDRPIVKRFRVEDEDQQAADAIADDQAEVTEPAPKPKALKPVVEPTELAEEDDETEALSDSEATPHVYVGKKVYHVRYPRRHVSYNTYRYVKRHSYAYDSDYSGSSCNNNNGY